MSRDERMFMTGVIVGAFLSGVARLIHFPWWLNVPLAIAGIWVIFTVARAWVRDRT